MKRNYILFLLLSTFLISCGPDEPEPLVHKLVTDVTGPIPVIYRCCYGPGTDCSGTWWETMLTSGIRSYIEQGEVGNYFATQDWQAAIPELVGKESLISEFITQNPKGIFLGEGDDEILVLLKDSTLPYSKENILFTFVQRIADEPCPGYPGE